MKKILEIGGGRNPYFVRYKIPWDLMNHYIAIDLDQENIELAKESIRKYSENGNFCPIDPVFILSDASSIEIQDEYFDEIIISNTLSAPIHRNWDRDGNVLKIKKEDKVLEKFIKDKSSKEDPFYIERLRLVQEALRVLKFGGKIYIYTDLIIYGHSSYERILEDLKNDSKLEYFSDKKEAFRIDLINLNKLDSNEFCCCFRAEILPRSEVHVFTKIKN